MFDWLVDEMERINTRKFHDVDKALSVDRRELFQNSEISLPPSYQEFVIQFGNAKLYHSGNIYLVQVYSFPSKIEMEDGDSLLHFGRTDLAPAYFKESLLVSGSESPVFEWSNHKGLHKTVSGFEKWLEVKCKASRKLFSKKQWKAIEEGPPPFTAQEEAIVQARRKFHWRVIGISKNGDLQFEVHNGSDLLLPFLSIGVRGKHGQVVDGGIYLPTSSVLPDQTCIIEKGCYKKLLPPEDIEVFEEPDPEPEDRDRYWEFRVSNN
jgi:hypothetical protein